MIKITNITEEIYAFWEKFERTNYFEEARTNLEVKEFIPFWNEWKIVLLI